MNSQENFIIFSAESTHKVITLEKLFLENNIQCRIIPLPTEISANCGLSIKIDLIFLERAKAIVLENNLNFEISSVEKIGFKKIITKL